MVFPNDTPMGTPVDQEASTTGVIPASQMATIDHDQDTPPVGIDASHKSDGLNHESMSLHLALRELKTLHKRISSAMIDMAPACIAVAKSKAKSDYVAMAVKDGDAALKSLLDMIRRYDAIKSAVTLANVNTAVTMTNCQVNSVPVSVTYDNSELTLAEIIEKRGYYRSYIAQLLGILSQRYTQAKASAEKITRDAETTGLTLVNAKTNDKLDVTQLEMYRSYVEDNQGVVISCIEGRAQITDLIQQLQDRLNLIDTQFDAALSVANATSTIDIAYPVGKASL